MTEELAFSEDDVIRMNITLGITGDMFRSQGVFFTDFMQTEETNESRIPGKVRDILPEDADEDDEEEMMSNERVDPTF